MLKRSVPILALLALATFVLLTTAPAGAQSTGLHLFTVKLKGGTQHSEPRVSIDRRPDLAEKFGIEQVPTICVVEDRKLRRRIVSPRGCRELERELEPWLQ